MCWKMGQHPSSGGESLQLNSPLTNGGDVSLAQFSSDGQRIVYLADQDADNVVELFSVAASGGDPVRLNEPLLSSQDVISFQISPDGQHVTFRADQQNDEQYELYHVPIAGGEVVRLNSDLVNGGDVTDWLVSPDSRRVVYRADQDVDEKFEIYSVPLVENMPGDFNNDGVVDAADYSVWRDGLGSKYDADGYGLWKANFGRNSTSGPAGGATVPEPTAWVLLTCILAGLPSRLDRTPTQSRKSCSARREGTYSSVT